MKREIKKIVTALRKLEAAWPDGVILFAYNNSLLLLDDERTVIDSFSIPSDGGDPATSMDEDGNTQLIF